MFSVDRLPMLSFHTYRFHGRFRLQEQLRQQNIRFLSEDIQKTNRHVRTPDCALLTPIEVHGHLCHWVESKACFGDRPTLEDTEREQFHSYVERVGPGVVIYWYVNTLLSGVDQVEAYINALVSNDTAHTCCRFDFIEDHPDIDLVEWRDRGILVVSKLPDEVILRPDVPVQLPASFTDQARLLKSRAEGGTAPPSRSTSDVPSDLPTKPTNAE